MRSQFDGLRSILRNSAVPSVEAPAVEEPPVSAPDAFADLPGLSELDRGLYKTDSKTVHTINPGAAALEGLDRGLASPHAPLLNDVRSLKTPARRATSSQTEPTMSNWVAVAVMAFGLVLGATAAMGLFHDDVAHILTSWDGVSASQPARAK